MFTMQSVLNGILKSFGDEVTDDTRQAAVAKLDQAGERVKGLKRKVRCSDTRGVALLTRSSTIFNPTQRCRRRCDHA
jgi:hypothetical protein